MKHLFSSLVIALGLLFSGCENKTESGALIGTGVGVAGGALIAGTPQGAIIGGAIGAVGGTLIGHALDEQDRKSMQKQSPQTLKRIDNGEPLSIDDVKEMTKAGIHDDVIISQIESTQSVYHLTPEEIIDLKQAGVSERVIDFMVQTGS